MSAHPQPQSAARTGFLAAWQQMVGVRGVPTIPRRPGRKPRVPLADLLAALTFHVMQGAGTLAEHFADLFDDALADSSWADRRARPLVCRACPARVRGAMIRALAEPPSLA